MALGETAPVRPRRGSRGEPPEDVEIDFVILADFAQAAGGKLNLIGGGWNVYRASQYPVVLPFGLGIAFLIPWSLTNRKHPWSFMIRKSEGIQLATGGGDFEIGREAGIPAGMKQRVTIGMSGQLQLLEPGAYEIIVKAGQAEKRVTFEALTAGQAVS